MLFIRHNSGLFCNQLLVVVRFLVMSVDFYTKGCHLLNYNDVIATRRVPYILHPQLWQNDWGGRGALELYPTTAGPEGISEPAWASLAFDQYCYVNSLSGSVCTTNFQLTNLQVCHTTGVRTIFWAFRMRMCNKCRGKE